MHSYLLDVTVRTDTNRVYSGCQSMNRLKEIPLCPVQGFRQVNPGARFVGRPVFIPRICAANRCVAVTVFDSCRVTHRSCRSSVTRPVGVLHVGMRFLVANASAVGSNVLANGRFV